MVFFEIQLVDEIHDDFRHGLIHSASNNEKTSAKMF